MAQLTVQGLTINFAAAPALRDVTLSVERGEWLAIIGPNGAGKSTLLRAIAAALAPASGAVFLDDVDVLKLPARERAKAIAVLPQDHATAEGWTVAEVVAHGRSPHLGLWKRESGSDREAVQSATEATETERLAGRDIATLSGGERQRVLLARALAQEPAVLLLDEPTASLDLQYQWEMLELVDRIRRARNVTVVSVLHDLNLAGAFADRLTVLKSGEIAALGTPAEVLTEETIANVYGRRVTVSRHPANGRPMVMSWPTATPAVLQKRIHVICGGGTGSSLLRRLVADGHTVTAGVLNIGDSDWETARALGLEIAEEAPFSAISSSAKAAAEALAAQADAVIVTEVPIGPGNIANLEIGQAAAEAGRNVLLVGEMTAERDFTAGAATEVWRAALEAGATTVPDNAKVMELRERSAKP